MRFVSAVLHASNTADKYQQEYYPTKTPKPALYETCVLMDWVYNNFRLDNALDTGAFVTERPVKYSTQADTVKLYPKEGLYTILPNESDESTIQRTYDLPETLAAPIKQGDVVGTVTLSLAGRASARWSSSPAATSTATWCCMSSAASENSSPPCISGCCWCWWPSPR